MSETARMMAYARKLSRHLGLVADVSKVCHTTTDGDERTFYTASIGASTVGEGDTPHEAFEALLDVLSRRQDSHFEAPDPCPELVAAGKEGQ